MNKFIFFILFIIVSLVYILDTDNFIGKQFTIFNHIKGFYLKEVEEISNFSKKYFQQATNIEKLKVENEQLKKYRLLYESKNQTLKDLINTSKELNFQNEKLTKIKTLSYVEFNDFTKVWLDEKKEDKKIAALIDNNYAAGIVIEKDGHALGLLNGNEKANYAVYIGENSAPGIIVGIKNSKYIMAKYIPIWIKINVGDEVITSGMDNIFFKGLKVGKVVSINKMSDMQEATIEPYAKVLKKRFFYIYQNSSQDLQTKPKKL